MRYSAPYYLQFMPLTDSDAFGASSVYDWLETGKKFKNAFEKHPHLGTSDVMRNNYNIIL